MIGKIYKWDLKVMQICRKNNLSKLYENIHVHPYYITFIQKIFSIFELCYLYAEISEALSLTFFTFLFFTLFDAASKSSAILE